MLSAYLKLLLKRMMKEVGIMSYQYKYDKEYQTLQQFDTNGVLRSSMSMPQSDLGELARLNIKENVLRVVDKKIKTDV
jgi:hypothetical protein